MAGSRGAPWPGQSACRIPFGGVGKALDPLLNTGSSDVTMSKIFGYADSAWRVLCEIENLHLSRTHTAKRVHTGKDIAGLSSFVSLRIC